jgi:hypothetical protein
MPSEDELDRLILDRQPAHRGLYLEIHRLVLDAVPDVRYSVDLVDGAIGYGAHQFGYDGWGLGALSPHKGWVSLILFRGAELDDPQGLLEGTGAPVRHVKLRSVEKFDARREGLTRLVRAAVDIGRQ